MSKKVFTVAELAKLTHSTLRGDAAHAIHAVADLESAGPQDISFLNKLPFGQTSRYEQIMRKSQAGAIFVHPDTPLVEGRNFLLNEDPSRAFQIVLETLNGTSQELTGFSGIHPTAVIHPTATIAPDATIGPHVVIDKDAVVGPKTQIGPGCYIGPGVTIGPSCILHAHVTVRERCIMGQRVILQPGVVIGSCGFGYTTDKQGRHTKLNQVGNVVIEDDVEIGANTTIDRSRFKSTRIGRGTKIDNLVQIGHGVKIGEDNIIVSQTGIAGSSETGKNVVIAGQCGISGHIKLGNGVILSARAGVDRSLPEAGKYGGAPVTPLGEHNRNGVFLRNIRKYIAQINARLDNLEKSQ